MDPRFRWRQWGGLPVRVQGMKPDAANQPGGQMAVAELEVYADNGNR